jgi:molybdenum cofactor guanylyltransferase
MTSRTGAGGRRVKAKGLPLASVVRLSPGSSGFVLVGGASSRMGRDKALLPVGGRTLVEDIAAQVRAAAGSVCLIGAPQKYGHLGLPVVADKIENCGPLGGLYTALSCTEAEWIVLVACDMPGVTAAFLEQLLDAAETSDADCVVPETGGKIDPLCAVYHRRIEPLVASAIDRKLFKMQDFVSTLRTCYWPVADPRPLQNVNTPAEWSAR